MRSTSRFTIHGILAILLVGIPAGATLAATLSGPQAQPISGIPQQPGLAFYQYIVDLGAVRPAEEISARFGFANTGKEPVTIQEIIPSCGCLKPTLRPNIKTYDPGKTGGFQVRIRTAGEAPGQREYTLRVKYTDPQPREELLTFRVKLPDNQVTYAPRALVVYQLNGNPTTSEVVITDRRDKPLEIVNVATSNPLVQAEVGPKSVDKFGHQQYSVRVTVAGKVPSRLFNAIVKVFTNDSTYRSFQIPLMIQGPSVATRNKTGQPGESQLH